ncbi:nuclear transport factor 2 family protein [Pendulispora brunnea]|uniref:Nuclear transport factor 2 family protein n=1 Tax=Pendulispora brunnea TaxID=2905690 RepID=A0ABZ2K492_9BACT
MTSSANEQLVDGFYRALAKRDWETMVAAYHPDVHFTDPVFDLRGARAAGMWRMLCESAKDISVVHSGVRATEHEGAAHWEATYTFSLTGRRVLNVIDARFEFRDGKILRHVDTFDFWKWAGQALGPTGKLLGWTPFVRGKVRRTANGRLEKFLSR